MKIAYEVGDRPQRLVRQPLAQCTQELYRLGMNGALAIQLDIYRPSSPRTLVFVAEQPRYGRFVDVGQAAKGHSRWPGTSSLISPDRIRINVGGLGSFPLRHSSLRAGQLQTLRQPHRCYSSLSVLLRDNPDYSIPRFPAGWWPGQVQRPSESCQCRCWRWLRRSHSAGRIRIKPTTSPDGCSPNGWPGSQR